MSNGASAGSGKTAATAVRADQNDNDLTSLRSIDGAIPVADPIVVVSRRPGRIRDVVEAALSRSCAGYDVEGEPTSHRLREHRWSLIEREAFGADIVPEGSDT